MKKVTFNLQKFYRKAYYDDGKGLVQEQTRCMMNCYKTKLDEGITPQKAFDSCLKEYQTSSKDGKWSLKYANKKSNTKK